MTQIEGNGLRNDDGELMYVADREQICQATFKDHCQYPKCDCDRPKTKRYIPEGHTPVTECYPLPDDDTVDPPLTREELEYARRFTGIIQSYVSDPSNGGKVTCHTCNGFIFEGDAVPYLDHQHPDEFPKAHFHKDCYNPYEHYYGLDRPID